MTLIQRLETLYQKYGYHVTALDSFSFGGEQGFNTMQKIMHDLREDSSNELCGIPVVDFIDYLNPDVIQRDGSLYHAQIGLNNSHVCYDTENRPPVSNLPKSDVLQYTLQDKSLITIRPSGTEPKLKIYYQVKRSSSDEAEKAVKKLRKDIKDMVSGK